MPAGGITVYLRGGTYRLREPFVLEEADSGTPGREIRYQGYPGEEVRLCGSVGVRAEDFQAVSDPDTVARLRPQAAEHVRVMDLLGQGITEYGQLYTRGMGQDTLPMQMELTIDDQAYELASYPKTGYSHVGTVLDGRREPGAIFQYTDDRAEAWTQAEDLWLYGYLENAYADSYVGVSKVDPEAKTFTLRHGTPWGVSETPPFGGKHNKYRGYNLLEEISAPGEYYIDRTHGRLYVWPKGELKPDSRVELSALEERLISMEGCHDIQLDSLILENTRGVGIHEDSCENIIIQNSVFRNIGIVAVNMGKGCVPKWREQPDTSPEAILKSRLVGDLKGYLWRYPGADRCPGFNNFQTTWSGRSVFVNGGQFNTVRGNCWYQTAVIYEFPPRWYDGKEYVMEILRDCQHWIQAMDIGGPLWRERYPKLAQLAGDCRELSYSPLNNVYTDSKVFETVEEMLADPRVDANRFRQIGRYPN